ncbi:2734_t:CDS:2, partial [Dentiscutata heterogama]
MGSGRDLTEAQRGAIIYGHQWGDSICTIVATVKCSKSAMWNVITEFRSVGAVAAQKKKRHGHPKHLSPTKSKNLKKLVTDGNCCLNVVQITNLHNSQSQKKISTRTVRCVLRSENLGSCVAVLKPLIIPENKQKRYDWALEHEAWTVQHFRHVLWSDEISIRLFQGSPARVWHESHEKWNMDCLSATVGQSQITGASHIEQDNAKPHFAELAKSFMAKNQVWSEIPPELCRRLISGMPDQAAA